MERARDARCFNSAANGKLKIENWNALFQFLAASAFNAAGTEIRLTTPWQRTSDKIGGFDILDKNLSMIYIL